MSVRLAFALVPVLRQERERCIYICALSWNLWRLPGRNEHGHLQVSPPAVASAPFLCLCMRVHSRWPAAKGRWWCLASHGQEGMGSLTATRIVVHGSKTELPLRYSLCRNVKTKAEQDRILQGDHYLEVLVLSLHAYLRRGRVSFFMVLLLSQQLRNNWKLQMSGQEWKIILTRPECQAISTSEIMC